MIGKLEVWWTQTSIIVVSEEKQLSGSWIMLLGWFIGNGVKQEIHVAAEDALIVELVLHVPTHLEDQLKVVIRKMVWVERSVLNTPNYFLMLCYCCIKINRWSIFHGQPMGYLCGSRDIPCCLVFQSTGENFFLDHTTT